MSSTELLLEKKRLLEQKISLQQGLPHLYGWKWYSWAREFFESRNKITLLCKANQISGSSTQIRKITHWATAVDLWPSLWASIPRQFWYLYPTRDVAHIEWRKKWEPEFMPRKEYKDHPQYGWKEEIYHSRIFAIHFNSGVSVYFKTYAQNVQDLQTGSVSYLACFVAGTKILTSIGLLDIEKIKVGDFVATQAGFSPVKQITSRVANVITREFDNGERITATADHRFWCSQVGWVNLANLTRHHCLIKIPGWKNLKRLSYFRDCFITAIQKAGIIARGIIFVPRESNYTSSYGKRTAGEMFRRGMLCTILILTRWIIGLRIYNYCRGLTTQWFTSWLNGRKRGLGHLPVLSAASDLKQEALSLSQSNIVRQNVAGQLIERLAYVSGVALRLLVEGIKTKGFVLSCAQTEQQAIGKQRVFDLSVDGPHSFFANGYLVHNCDEEPEEDVMGELFMRLAATNGYFSAVFTPTLGQQYWYEAIELRGKGERFPTAKKLNVTMYDCLRYEDGSQSPWNMEMIERAKAACKTEAEIQRRIYGKFVSDEDKVYPSYSREKNRKPAHPLPKDWLVYVGVDIGSGGDTGHPSAITFCGVRPDFKMGRIFRGWHSGKEIMTAAMVVEKVLELSADLSVAAIRYDWACADFWTIAQGMGLDVEPANKNKSFGEQTVNVLFKNQILAIYDLPELDQLDRELTMLKKTANRTTAKNDACDSLKYCVSSIPWDYSDISSFGKLQGPQPEKWTPEKDLDWRRRGIGDYAADAQNLRTVEEELGRMNELMYI